MQAATILVRKTRGVLYVYATGQTNSGQKFLKGQVALKAKTMRDPNFKAEMAAAVTKLLGNEALSP